MKKFFFLILTILALHSRAQIKYVSTYTVPLSGIDSIYQSGDTITTCKNDTVKAGYFKDSVRCYSVVVPKTCYDTIPKTCFDTLKKTCYDTTYTTVISNCHKVKTGGWRFWNRYKTVCDTTKKMNVTSRSCNIISSRSCPVISSRDCSTSYIKCDTLKSYFYFPPIVIPVCDTIIITKAKVLFGAKVQDGTSDEQISVAKSLGVSVLRPVAVELSSYVPGQKQQRLVDFYNATPRIYPVLNVNWVLSNTNGFCKDTALYRKQIKAFLKDYGYMFKNDSSAIVIENEPSNDQYYGATASMNDYLKILTIAVDEGYKAGVLVADGCLHVEVISSIAAGIKSTNKSVIDQKILLAGYTKIPHLIINLHKVIKGDSRDYNSIITVVNYLRSVTGHEVMCNEFHGESATQAALQSTVSGFIDSKVKFLMIFGGGGSSPADPINGATVSGKFSVTAITDLGTWFSSDIKQ